MSMDKEKIKELWKKQEKFFNNELSFDGFATWFKDTFKKLDTHTEETFKAFADILTSETRPRMIHHPACMRDGHKFEVLKSNYFKKINGVYDQSQSYTLLYCIKCGDTKEIVLK